MRFLLCKRLFSGNFSVVHRARDMKEEKDVVLKRCRYSQHARKEINIIRDLHDYGCRNIIRLSEDRLVGDDEIRFTEAKHEYYNQVYDHPATIASELCSAIPSAYSTDADVCDILFDLLTALSDVHSSGYIHADVKRSNILRDSECYRLIDFGISIPATENTQHPLLRGTPFYMAPEIVQGLPITPMIDMYAVGVLIYDLLHNGEHPIEMMNTVSGERGFQALLATSCYDPSRWLNSDSPLAGDLCKHLLQKYSAARLTASEALDHPLFKSKHLRSTPH